MNFEYMDMGGATFCIAGLDGKVQKWVEPMLTQKQLTRTWKMLETPLMLEECAQLNKFIELETIGLQGCSLEIEVRRKADRYEIELDGCGDFVVDLVQSKGEENVVILRVHGHGTRSCGLLGMEAQYTVPTSKTTLKVEQHWAWPDEADAAEASISTLASEAEAAAASISAVADVEKVEAAPAASTAAEEENEEAAVAKAASVAGTNATSVN